MVILRLFVITVKKLYLADSKGCGTANLLNHTPVCVKNPNRVTLKRQQTLALLLNPKSMGRKGFSLCQQPLLLKLLGRHSLKWL